MNALSTSPGTIEWMEVHAQTPPATKPYHHGNLRAALLEEAARIVDERGVQALSLRELARAVGVSHGAPRRHFADKQSLLEALAEDGFIRLERAMREAVADDSRPFTDRLDDLGRTYLRFATQHGALVELMFAIKHRPGSERVREAGERAFQAPLQLFADAQARGEIVDGDAEAIASLAFATIHGLASLANAGVVEDPTVLPEIMPYASALMMNGLRPRE